MLYLVSGQNNDTEVINLDSIVVETTTEEFEKALHCSKPNQAIAYIQAQRSFFFSETKLYKTNMFRVAKSILNNNADAEDAVSESIIKSYTNLHTLKKQESFKPWIMKILVRECYKILKKRRSIDYYDVMPDIPVIDTDNTQILWTYVNQLPYEFRSVVVLFYYEDMSIKYIAKTLSLSQGTVKSRLSRARAKLKLLLEDNGGFEYDRFG